MATCKECGLGRSTPEMMEYLAAKLRACSSAPALGDFGAVVHASAIGALAGVAAVAANVLAAEAHGLCVFCHDKQAQEAA